MEQKSTFQAPEISKELLSKLSKNKAAQYTDIRNKTYNAGVQFYKAINQVEKWKLTLNDAQKAACEFIFGVGLETMPLNYKHAYMLKKIGKISEIKTLNYREFNFFQEFASKIEVRGYDNAIKLYDAIHAFEEQMNDMDVLVKQQQTAAKIFQTINAEYGRFCSSNHVVPEDIESMANEFVFGISEANDSVVGTSENVNA